MVDKNLSQNQHKRNDCNCNFFKFEMDYLFSSFKFLFAAVDAPYKRNRC